MEESKPTSPEVSNVASMETDECSWLLSMVGSIMTGEGLNVELMVECRPSDSIVAECGMYDLDPEITFYKEFWI